MIGFPARKGEYTKGKSPIYGVKNRTERRHIICALFLYSNIIRRLLEAFEPHQDAMFADLDRQIEESNPDIISRKIDEFTKQSQRQTKQLDQISKTANGIDEAALIALLDEMIALHDTQMTLWEQLRSTTRQNNVLNYKRVHLVELLQTIHTMRQEGIWENVGEKEKCPVEWSILGERFIVFEFTKQHHIYCGNRLYQNKYEMSAGAQEARARGITNPGEVFRYAHQKEISIHGG